MSELPRMSRTLTALSPAALCAVVQGYAAPAWSEAQPLAASNVGSRTLPAGPPTTVINPRQADATFADYTFRDGETLPSLRLHYALLGTPH